MLVTEVVTNVVAVVVATGVIPNGEDITRAGESSRRRWYHHPYRHCFLFRHYEGNFYTGVIYSLQKLSQGEDKKPPATAVRHAPVELPEGYRPLTRPALDSTQAGRP